MNNGSDDKVFGIGLVAIDSVKEHGYWGNSE